jgi:hypothetical protein
MCKIFPSQKGPENIFAEEKLLRFLKRFIYESHNHTHVQHVPKNTYMCTGCTADSQQQQLTD